MRNNRKKLLAVFTAFLMVAFIVLPQFGPAPGTGGDIAIGEIGGTKVTPLMINSAYNAWEYLGQHAFVVQKTEDGREQRIPVTVAMLGPQLTEQARDNQPIIFFLQEEARRIGVTVGQAELNNALENIQVRVPDRTGTPANDRYVLFENLGETEMADNVRHSMAGLLMIQKSFERAASVVKISQPIIERTTAQNFQEVKLKFVEFSTKDFESQVPAPTPQQLQEFFEKYSDNLPGSIDPKTNPAGYGYKYPNRVKVQYLAISQDELRRAVRAGKEEYDWEVAAQRFYKNNQSLFPATQPTTLPSDTFSLVGPATRPSAPVAAPSTQPTTRPFEEVKEQVIERLVEPEIEKLGDQVQRRILSALGGDFNAYRSARLAVSGMPATQPRSSVGVPYDTVEYLQALAADVQKHTGVVVKVVSLGDKFLNAEELAKLEGIGDAGIYTGGSDPQSSFFSFRQYAIGYAEAFLQEGQRRLDGMLSLWEPSRPISDFIKGDTYIFRLSATDPSHKPASLSEIADQVEKDWRAQAAIDLTSAAAEKMKTEALANGLHAAAQSAGKTISETDYMSGISAWRDPALNISEVSRALLATRCMDLLAEAKKAPEKPVLGVIPLPEDSKVLLAELSNTRPFGQGALTGALQHQQVLRIMQQEMQGMYSQWFTFDAVKSRVGFVDRATLQSTDKS